MKILNLYAGIGGNRKLWTDCNVTAVEYNAEIAAIYKDNFPGDEVIVTDAHEYLLNNYYRFDFIWSSPPCQTHSSIRQNLAVRYRGTPVCYPDMKLWQEIIFLQYNAKCKWVIKNVNPYYKPLIPAQLIQRHLFWSNFTISDFDFKSDSLRTAQINCLEKHHNFDLSKYGFSKKRQVLRNCVNPEIGLHILNEARFSFLFR